MPHYLVTGASSGIGAALATALLRRSDKVTAMARREDRLAALDDNDVTGRDGFRAIFEHMFKTCEEPRFHILDIATSTDQGEQRAYLRWRMSGRVKGLSLIHI